MMTPQTLLIRNENEHRRINIHNIIYVRTNDYLSTFFLKHDQKINCSKPLNKIACILPDHFLRINRSVIINMNEIVLVKPKRRTVIMVDSTEISISVRKIKDLHVALAIQNITFTR